MAMTTEDKAYTVALSLCPALERRSLNHLVYGLGGAKAVWTAPEAMWRTQCQLRKHSITSLNQWRLTNNPFRLLDEVSKGGVVPIVRGDDRYPVQLEEWGTDAPITLFAKGQVELLTADSTMVSVVGTRRASTYGLEATGWIATTLAGAGCTIVSGMAIGIDASAHRAALEAHGRTIAVLGGGVNVCYPPSNRSLYDEMVNTGLIISEYPPDAPVARHHFPERNRLIAGLSQTLVIIQAGERSGALRTVDAALTLGKDVYVVPGPITSKLFRGSNQLLKDGASALVDPVDLLSDLKLSGTLARPSAPVKPLRWHHLYEVLDTPQSASALAKLICLPQGIVYTALMELELEGWIQRLPGGLYRRK